MAVLQISRIQLRRGKKNEASGLPQLASGEMAWAIDAQELYIGSGSVNEGAPAVENVRVLTEKDNILDLAEQYQYKANDENFITGVDGENFPVIRTLQDRLDDFVTSSNYGILANGSDQTASIQNAITNLFVTTESRVVLQFQPGVFEISDTIDIPSYVSIEGAGAGKTIFNFTGTGTVFNFIKDDDSLTIQDGNQPRFISMKGFTVQTDSIATQVFNLSSVRDSIFEDIEITGAWTNVSATSTTSIGIGMYAFSSLVTCQRNKFTRVTVDGFCTGVLAKEDIFNNLFDACSFNHLEVGFKFGVGANLSSTGQEYGPRKNIIKNSRFETINQHGIIVDNGYGNRSRSNTFIDVGNDASGNTYTPAQDKYVIIKFTSTGNSSTQDIFDRAIDLASTGFGDDAYLAEVEGSTYFSSPETRVVSIGQASSATPAFRIPINETVGITINYLYQSISYEQMRKGTISVALDRINNNIQFVDDYDYTGTTDPGDDEKLTFSGQIEDIDGYQTLVIYYTNSNFDDDARLTYSYTTLS
jgi:hypothetical protein